MAALGPSDFSEAAFAAPPAGFVRLALAFGHPTYLRRFGMLETPPPMCPPRAANGKLFQQRRAAVSVRIVPATARTRLWTVMRYASFPVNNGSSTGCPCQLGASHI
jgi:hypothetical protein